MTDKDITDRVRDVRAKILADDHFALRKVTFNYRRGDGAWQSLSRESYDIGDAAAVLPLDPRTGTVVLIRQFRWPVFESGHRSLMTEVIAGKLDGDTPQACIRRETLEEAGVTLGALTLVCNGFMSPGAVKERVAMFLADYDSKAPRQGGGGLAEEGEDIDVLQLPLDEAFAMIATGEIIDGKTVLLLQAAKLKTAK